MLSDSTDTGDGAHSAFGVYLRELRRFPLLPREIEHDIAVKFRAAADPQLAAQLITSNLRLVVKIAKQYRRAHSSFADLVQEGNVGLVHAITKYDPSRGVKVASYAAWWIRAYILHFVISNHRLIKIGTTQGQRRLFFNLAKEREKLARQGVEVEPKQLAAALYVTEREVVEMERRLEETETSLDAPAGGEGEVRTRDVSAAAGARPDVTVEAGEFNALLVDKLNAFGAILHGRELEIFRERLFNEDPAQLGVFAGRYGVSRQRVRQIEVQLKQRLREYLEAELGDAVAIDRAN
jgi:RNA polymerase sigma-32 factor